MANKTNGEPNCFGGFGAYRYLSILIEDGSLFCDENKKVFQQVLLEELGSFRFVMNDKGDVPSFEKLSEGFGRLDIGKSSEGFVICRCTRQLDSNAKDITEIVKAKMRIKMKQKPSLVNKGEQQGSVLIIISMKSSAFSPTVARQNEYLGKDILCTRDYLKNVGVFNEQIGLFQRNKEDWWYYRKEGFNYIYDTTTDTCLIGDIKDVPPQYRLAYHCQYHLPPKDENGNIWCVLKQRGDTSLYPKENKDEGVKCNPTSLDSYLDSTLGKRKEERDKAYQDILTKFKYNQQ